MCCFSGSVGSVQWVANTSIFARPLADDRQLLVYQMSVHAKEELAMILPLPTPRRSPERAVRFLSFKAYPDFFTDMAAGFPQIEARGGAGGGAFAAAPAQVQQLRVFEVGSFVASFVPALADFQRLDKRFRLADGVWEKLPRYMDYGFAVFQLKPGEQTIHPMALTFPRAIRQLFFPTVHIHDGEFHEQAEFDHQLFFQLSAADFSPQDGWDESRQPAGMFLKLRRLPGLLNPLLHCYRKTITGKRKNADILL